ncbi:hypothetical protein G6F35_013911 [Rhizopus arrhizus]|nr:hypothetical protein G6F35_013911 [Rhizopus arrhizus]
MRRQRQNGGLHRQRLQCLVQRAQAFIVEAGAYATDIAQAGLVLRGQKQRAESYPRTLGCRVTDDHELVGVLVLDLDPAARTGIHIGRVDLLADDALETRLATGSEHLWPVIDHMLTEGEDAGYIAQQRFQQRLAFQQGRAADVGTGNTWQVEDDVAQRLFRTAVDHPLQCCEVTAALRIQYHQFTVQARIAHRQRPDGLHDFGKIGPNSR